VDDLVADLDQLQVGDVERPDGLDRQVERISASPAIGGSHLAAKRAKLAQHTGPVEALPFTVFAKTHR
jgi:hypothetical protein